MSDPTPLFGYEDLFPHVAVFEEPGHPMHGETVMSRNAVAALIAPSYMAWREEWERQAPAILAGEQEAFVLPEEWQRGQLRRGKELQAEYNTVDMFEVLRGLERDLRVLTVPHDPHPESVI